MGQTQEVSPESKGNIYFQILTGKFYLLGQTLGPDYVIPAQNLTV